MYRVSLRALWILFMHALHRTVHASLMIGGSLAHCALIFVSFPIQPNSHLHTILNACYNFGLHPPYQPLIVSKVAAGANGRFLLGSIFNSRPLNSNADGFGLLVDWHSKVPLALFLSPLYHFISIPVLIVFYPHHDEQKAFVCKFPYTLRSSVHSPDSLHHNDRIRRRLLRSSSISSQGPSRSSQETTHAQTAPPT
jgi:hypothetical protein